MQNRLTEKMKNEVDKTIIRNAVDSACDALKEIRRLAQSQMKESVSPHFDVFSQIEHEAKTALERLPADENAWPK